MQKEHTRPIIVKMLKAKDKGKIWTQQDLSYIKEPQYDRQLRRYNGSQSSGWHIQIKILKTNKQRLFIKNLVSNKTIKNEDKMKTLPDKN